MLSRRKHIYLAVAWMILSVSAARGVAQSPGLNNLETEKRKAAQSWEALIKAKGGRERLHSVQNFIMEWGKPATAVYLFSFPNKYWMWSNEGPGPERWSAMTFYDGNPDSVYYWITEDGPIRDVPRYAAAHQDWVNEKVIPYLLETKWVRPDPVRVRRVRDGRELLDVIETRVNGERFDFAFEVERMLVLRVTHYSIQYKKGTVPFRNYLLSDYYLESGIQMPHGEQMVDDGVKLRKRTLYYLFNVEYDKDFFKQPPPLSAGPDAWKPKRLASGP